MRTITAPHRTLLGGQSLNFHLKAEIENESGTWIDVSTRVIGVDWSESIDQPVMAGTLRLTREIGTDGTASLAPLVQASLLNRDDFAAYSPLVHPGRGFRTSVAVTAAGVAPVGGDWHLVFLGLLDDPEWAGEPNLITVPIRDIGGRLADQIIETKRDYSSVAGIALEDLLVLMAEDNGFLGLTVTMPGGSPGWMVRRAEVERGGSLFEAMRAYALQIGWELRYGWGTGDAFDLTLYAPDRTNTTAAITIPPSEYLKVSKAHIGDVDVRNYGLLIYQNSAGLLASVTAIDSASINTFGRRYIEIREASTSNIDSASEAQDMIDAVIADLSTPLADHEINTFYLWPVQLGDLVEFPANSVHDDQTQKYAVVASSVAISAGHMTQTLLTRGKPAGAYRQWILRHGSGPLPGDGLPAPKFTYMLGEESHGGGLTGDGMVWIGLEFERNTKFVQVWGEEGDTANTPTPNVANNSSAITLYRQEGVDSSAADWKTVIGIATRPLRWRSIRACGYGANGEQGPDWMPPPVQAIDPTPAPGDGKIIAFSVATGLLDTNILAITPGQLPAGDNWVFIRRNGVDIYQLWIGQDTAQKFWSDVFINPNAQYRYEACVWNSGVSGKWARVKAGLLVAPGVWWDQQAPKLVWDGGNQRYSVALYWALSGLPTANNIHFETGIDGVSFPTEAGSTGIGSTVFLDINVQPKWYRMRVQTAGNAILAYSTPAFWSGQGVPPSQGLVPPEWAPVPTARFIRVPTLAVGVPGLVVGFICATSGAVECAIQKSPDDGVTPWADVYKSGQLSGDAWTGGSVAENTYYRLQSRDAAGATLTNSASIQWIPI